MYPWVDGCHRPLETGEMQALKSFKAVGLGALHYSNGKTFGIQISNWLCKNGAVGILHHCCSSFVLFTVGA